MNIDEIIKLLTVLKTDNEKKEEKTKDIDSIFDEFIGKYVIARTYSSGVLVGTLIKHSNTQVILKNARRIFNWTKRFTLLEVSLDGVGDGSKITEEVPLIALTQVIEILPCSEKAINQLKKYEAFKI